MADFPQIWLPPLFITSLSRWAGWADNALSSGAPTTSLTWVANQALYVPFILPWPYPVRRVFWANGGSVTTTNRDLGIYTASGTKIYSTGSVAASGADLLQYVTPTEFLLSPGRYFMAIVSDTSTASRGGSGVTGQDVGILAMAGRLQQATAFPLPATMTPAVNAFTVFPNFGFTMTSTGF